MPVVRAKGSVDVCRSNPRPPPERRETRVSNDEIVSQNSHIRRRCRSLVISHYRKARVSVEKQAFDFVEAIATVDVKDA